MQTIQENSRQIPKDKSIMTHSSYYDKIYGYLQSISKWDGKPNSYRYIPKKGFAFTKVGTALEIDRNTIAKYFKQMLDTEENRRAQNPILIRELEDRYELIKLDKDKAALIPQETLIILVSALNRRAISTYVYLYNRYYASSCKPFSFTYEQVKEAIGLIGKNADYNNSIVTGILIALEKLGLLKWHKLPPPIQYTTLFQVDKMSNIIIDDDIEFKNEKQKLLYDSLKNRK